MEGRCQRCWSAKNLVSHEVDANPRADPTSGGEGPPLQALCGRVSGDVLLFWEVYMRFGSTREMLQHYSSESEDEALRKLCVERDLNEREVLRGHEDCRAQRRSTTREEGERVPDLCESLRLRLRRRRAPGEERGGPRGLSDFPTLSRGQRHRQDLPGAQPGRIPHEDRSGLASQTIANILSNPVYCAWRA